MRASRAYWQQFDAIGTLVGATEQLFNPAFLRGSDTVIVDDAELARALVERHHLSLDALGRAAALLTGARHESGRRLLQVIHHAIVDVPRHDSGRERRPLIGSAAWDHLARTARRYDTDLRSLIASVATASRWPEPCPTEEAISVEDVEAAPPASVLHLFRTLAEELAAFERGEDLNSRVRITASGVDVWAMRKPARDRSGEPLVTGMALLVLDATPSDVFVDHLSTGHERLPDVRATVRLPENVSVVQYAGASNGHAALREQRRMDLITSEIAAERELFPVPAEQEAAVCFRRQRGALELLGFAPEQVLTFGSARGSNALAQVERLHVVGRPMPPGDDLLFLANVVHHDEPPVSGQIVLAERAYGGQRYVADVVDFADGRVSALLRAARDNEITQVIHRARLALLDPQQRLGFEAPEERRQVRLVLHTSHPVPGLRVDELRVTSVHMDVNGRRQSKAEERVIAAVADLRQSGVRVTVNAVARATGANKRTVTKALGTPVHTPRRDLPHRGVNQVPQSDEREGPFTSSSPPVEYVSSVLAVRPDAGKCLGGCGKPLPAGQKCPECAGRAVAEWTERTRSRAGPRRAS